MTDPTTTAPVGNIFLTEEERYEVFTVKAAERPHLLTYRDNQEVIDEKTSANTNHPLHEEKKQDGSEYYGEITKHDASPKGNNDPPLIDGCDLPGWRLHRLAFDPSSDEISGLLNIGPGSTLFRKADQLCYPCHLPSSRNNFQNLMDQLVSSPPSPERGADVVDATEIASRFGLEYEQRNIPAKIMGATNSWNCKAWSFDNFLDRFGDIAWRFSDIHGEMLTFRTYSKYLSTVEGLTDDSPLAIYDAEFGDEDSPTSVLLDEYSVPSCFSPDLFDLAVASSFAEGCEMGNSTTSRPPYRWILIGPRRSGTGLHVDPLWTNAWVTVLQGLKRWLLFPPCTPHDRIGMFSDRPQIPSSVWFQEYYHVVTSPDWPKEWRPVEVLQHPGETVFVPNGWPHLVLNLQLTVAVTHNYASEFGPFERMWEEVATEEPDFARRWYAGMVIKRDDLAERVMVYHNKALNKKRPWALDFGEVSC